MSVIAMPFSVVIPASTDVVWNAFRDRAVLRNWFGWHYDGLEAEIEQVFGDASVIEEGLALHLGGHLFTLKPFEESTVSLLITSCRATVHIGRISTLTSTKVG